MQKSRYIIFAFIVIVLMIVIGGGEKDKISIHPIEYAPRADLVGANTFDCIVYGTEPESIAAATTAARYGQSVLILGPDEELGGLMTLGKLNFIDMNYGAEKQTLTAGYFAEFYDAVGGSGFEIDDAVQFFRNSINQNDKIVLKTGAELLGVVKDERKLIGIAVLEGNREKTYYARSFIDASADADLAALAGVPFTLGAEDRGEIEQVMGVTLVFELENVKWLRVKSHLKLQNRLSRFGNLGDPNAGASGKLAFGYTREGFAYEPQDPEIRLRGLNLARQEDGNVLVNALIIFVDDVLDPDSLHEARERGIAELEHIIPFLNKNMVGFKKAKLAGVAEQLYVRESRHIKGEYRLNINDVLGNRYFWDTIAIGGYPVDIQATLEQRQGVVVGLPQQYGIPFRSLVPYDVDGLLVVGRSASFDSLAAGSARVIPIGMCTGEAAGVAVAYAASEGLDFRTLAYSEMDIEQIQELLRTDGAYLEPFELEESIAGHYAYPGVQVLRTLGLVSGGYNNEYGLSRPLEKWTFQNTLNGVLDKAGYPFEPFLTVGDEPRAGEILRITAIGFVGGPVADVAEARRILIDKEVLTPELEKHFRRDSARPDTGAAYQLLANTYDFLKNNGQKKAKE